MSSQPVFAVAPMMDCTDRYDRYFLRLLTRHTLLFTEMIHANAIIHGDREHLLGFDPSEHSIALQIGGSEPSLMGASAAIGAQWGYDEININVGCPSERVQAGSFGACLMKEPVRVADCVAEMMAKTPCPISVKCRIGVDDHDSFEQLCEFIATVASTGCERFYVHARKAWLKGLSPKQNREIPPLQYDVVRALKREFPQLSVAINGGIDSLDAAQQHLTEFDGVMLGRAAYKNPYLLAHVDQRFFKSAQPPLSRREIVESMLPFVEAQIARGIRLTTITRHMVGLYAGQPGAKAWRRYISENAFRASCPSAVLLGALEQVEQASSRIAA